MKNIVKVPVYNDADFTEQEILDFETLVNNQIKESERKGMIVYNKILFGFEPVIWDFDNNQKIYPIKQLTTNSVIEKPNLTLVK